MNGISLHQICVTYSRCTYTEDTSTPPKLTIYLCNIITPNKYHIEHNAYIMKIHLPPFQLTIHLWNTVTQNNVNTAQWTYTEDTSTSQIDNTSLQYHYTK